MPDALTLSVNLTDADRFYEALIEAHRNLDVEGSAAFNARLILVFANHIGKLDVLLEALEAARL